MIWDLTWHDIWTTAVLELVVFLLWAPFALWAIWPRYEPDDTDVEEETEEVTAQVEH